MRRAFLCGEDSLTGKSYEHRKTWVIERVRAPAVVFAMDICAYAVMSNHPVPRVDTEKTAAWTPAQVIEHWERLFHLPRGKSATAAVRPRARRRVMGPRLR